MPKDKLVVETDTKVLPPIPLYDSSGRKIAKVVDVIGPVNHPYLVCKALTASPEQLVGAKVFVEKEVRRKM